MLNPGQPVEGWDHRGTGNTLYGLDIAWGEPCYVVLGVGGPSGREMLGQYAPDLCAIAEVMAIEAELAHDGPGRMALNIRTH